MTETTEAVVGQVDDMATGAMKMARVGDHRVVVVRTPSGIYALDNACPHQGYGLATGDLDGELLTCQWHNWKYRVTDGRCVIGEEDVACHRVRIEGDDIIVAVDEPSAEERRETLWPSLRRGIERDYQGQVARDALRLLQAGASLEEIVGEGLRVGVPKTEWGIGHETAVAADVLTLAARHGVSTRGIAAAQAISGISESTRDRPSRLDVDSAEVDGTRDVFLAAINAENWAQAVGAIRRRLSDAPDDLVELRSWFIEIVSQHHYNYGHGAIYVQKVFELLRFADDELRDILLRELALRLAYGTREDTLPYMRKSIRALDEADGSLMDLAAAPGHEATMWADDGDALGNALLEAGDLPVGALLDAGLNGAGVSGLLNVISTAASRRLLRFDIDIELDSTTDFSWLDITHALTYVNAARWAWRHDPGPHTARLVMLSAFLVVDSGREERRSGVATTDAGEPGDLRKSILRRDDTTAVATALAHPADKVADILELASLDDLGGSFIVNAHLIKMAVAARAEAQATGSSLPLAAAARFLAAPRRERFVTGAAHMANDLIESGQPPQR